MKFYIHNLDIEVPIETYADGLKQFNFHEIDESEKWISPVNYTPPGHHIIELNTTEDFETLIEEVGEIIVSPPYVDFQGNYVRNKYGDKIRTIIIYDDYNE